jgi:hypothetical protein
MLSERSSKVRPTAGEGGRSPVYPRLSEATGLPCPQLLDRRWRFWRHRKRAALETTFRSF